LERKLPTAVQFNSSFYVIFDAEGGSVRPPEMDDERLESCWALVDSNALVIAPCACFQDSAKFIIQASSPKEGRWKRWLKYSSGVSLITALPSVMEMAAIV
jgi:hypothetical protein